MQWVQINELVYSLDTEESFNEAVAALVAANIASVPVWVGDPDSPECYQNGQKLFA